MSYMFRLNRFAGDDTCYSLPSTSQVVHFGFSHHRHKNTGPQKYLAILRLFDWKGYSAHFNGTPKQNVWCRWRRRATKRSPTRTSKWIPTWRCPCKNRSGSQQDSNHPTFWCQQQMEMGSSCSASVAPAALGSNWQQPIQPGITAQDCLCNCNKS